MYYHINDIIFLVRFPQFVGSPPRDVWTTAYWRGRPSAATSPLSARTLTPISPFLSFSNLLRYIGSRSQIQTIRTSSSSSLLCTRRLFTLQRDERISYPRAGTILEFELAWVQRVGYGSLSNKIEKYAHALKKRKKETKFELISESSL